jgi:hypothetical protein
VTHIYPAGANKGAGGKVWLYGSGLGDRGYVDWQAEWSDGDDDKTEGDDSGARNGWSMPSGVNVFCPFQSSEIAEHIEAEPNDDAASAERITLPVVLNGCAQKAADVDTVVFTAGDGETFVFEAFGRRLTSPMTAVVSVHLSAGIQLARKEGDGPLYFTAPSAGTYTLRISELFRETHAGDDYIYRVVAKRSSPDFQLHLSSDNLGLEPGATAKVKLLIDRLGGFDGEVRLDAVGLPAGVTLDTAVIAAGQNEIELSFTATADAPIGITPRISLIGTATIAAEEVSHAAVIDRPADLTSPPLETLAAGALTVDTLAVTVTHPPVFAITTTDVYGSGNRGATLVQTHHLERLAGFDGPVEVSLSDRQDRYLQGVTGPTLTIQPGQTEFDYPAFLPESMDLNRTARMVVMGVARVTDSSGREHFVTHRTKNQMVLRVCPSLLTLGAAEPYFEGSPGSTLTIPLRVGRTAEISGDVALEAVAMRDSTVVSATNIDVPHDVEQVDYQVQLAADATPGEQCRLRLRATGLRDGYPAVAETVVEIQVVDAR